MTENINDKNQKIAQLLNQKNQLELVKKKRDSIYKRKIKNIKTELKILKYKDFKRSKKKKPKKKKSRFSWKPVKQDYEYLKVNRSQLLPYLNQEVKLTGIIKKFSNGHLFKKQEPKACLVNVKVEDVELTHLWIKTTELNLFLKNDFIQLTGVIDFYFKKQEHPKFLSFGISKVQNLELIK